ncbi:MULTISPECIES: hypothetical protein [Micromonospora]|uniref:hypothetical protein n=1 Tax=Micromonospora TaxID=1873 RepID=UPI00064BBAAD|nr:MULTISPECIES: hypothetical protein [unclassified Micromonospora]MDG4756107.1 hypothetical protein [Micromonospora sp. WMMD718]MDG4756228.1 hypothetical protein [Micromonospora sp. WMMD718]
MSQHNQRPRANPHTLTPGMTVIFRNGGGGPERLATILPRGPLGQCMVQLETGPIVAVSEARELFQFH